MYPDPLCDPSTAGQKLYRTYQKQKQSVRLQKLKETVKVLEYSQIGFEAFSTSKVLLIILVI